nr:hypothetical transcript [Hymenolepis microstoma]
MSITDVMVNETKIHFTQLCKNQVGEGEMSTHSDANNESLFESPSASSVELPNTRNSNSSYSSRQVRSFGRLVNGTWTALQSSGLNYQEQRSFDSRTDFRTTRDFFGSTTSLIDIRQIYLHESQQNQLGGNLTWPLLSPLNEEQRRIIRVQSLPNLAALHDDIPLGPGYRTPEMRNFRSRFGESEFSSIHTPLSDYNGCY